MSKLTDRIKSFARLPFNPVLRPGGNVLERTYTDADGGYRPVLDQQAVKQIEPFGTKVPKHILDRSSGWSQLANLSHDFTIQKVQSAMRQAEFGDTRMLFGYFRDFFLTSGMVAAELSKRKLSTISEPYTILPFDKTSKDDQRAAKIVEEALGKYPNFNKALVHLMNAVVFPVSVLEKTFAPVEEDYGMNQYGLRYRIKELYPVDYNLLTYRLPYIPQGPINIGNQPVIPVPPLTQNLTGRPEDTIFNPDSWEPDLRFWSVFNNGMINFSYANMMAPDPNRHMVYRCNLLEGIARENWGGLGRSILWWTIMSQMGVDKFFQCLQRYGIPFIVARVDTSQVDTVDKVMKALDESKIIGALAVNKDAIVELKEMNMSNAAEAHKMFMDFCNDQISLMICGQVLSSHARAQGIGGGASMLQGQVREDIIKYDRLALGNVLRHQLFSQYLSINGIPGNSPKIVWGGSGTPEQNKDLSLSILNMSQAGYILDDDSMDDVNVQFGLQFDKVSGASSNGTNPDKKITSQPKEKVPVKNEETPSEEKERVIEEKLPIAESKLDDKK